MEATVKSPKVISQQSAEAKRLIANANAKKAIVDVKKAQANDVDKDEPEVEKPKVEKPAKEIKTPKVTKKSVVIEMISKKGGAAVKDIGQKIVDLEIDPDLEKNIRVVRLWLPKLGIKVEKLENGNYVKA
jgi:hypothetical protein